MKNRILKEIMTMGFIPLPGDLFRKNDSAVNGFAMSGITESWTAEPFLRSLSTQHSTGLPSSRAAKDRKELKNRILKEIMTMGFIPLPGDLFRKNDSAVNGFAMSGITESWTAEPFLWSLLR